MTEQDNTTVEAILLEAIWVMRWNRDKTQMTAVLTNEEANQICKNIIKELNNSGFMIAPVIK